MTNGFMNELNQMLPPIYSTKPRMNSEIPASGSSGPKMENRMIKHGPWAGMNARKTHVMINRTGTKIHTLLITGLTIGPSTVAIQALTPSGLMKPAMLIIAPMNMIRPQGMRVWKSLGFKMPNAHSTIPPSRATMPASKKLPIHRTRQTAMTTSATHSSFFIFPSSLYLSEK